MPGQDDKAIAAEMERLMREAAPEGADVEIELLASAPAALVPPDDPAIQLGQEAFERVIGARPLLLRVGGSLPVMSALEEKGIPTILTGFDLPEGNIHSPNERFRRRAHPARRRDCAGALQSLASSMGRHGGPASDDFRGSARSVHDRALARPGLGPRT